jgi:hypothetical protein
MRLLLAALLAAPRGTTAWASYYLRLCHHPLEQGTHVMGGPAVPDHGAAAALAHGDVAVEVDDFAPRPSPSQRHPAHRRAVFLRAEGGEEVRCGGTYERGARYSAVIEPPHLREGYNEHVMELGGGAVFAAESLHDVGCDGTRAFGSFLRGKGDTWDTAPAPVAVMPTAGGNVSLVAGYACVFGDGIWLTETCEFAPGR